MENINSLSQEGLESLLNKFVQNAEEERDLALERYRRQDESITTSEDFILQGKDVVAFLKTASERSNSLLQAAKIIKEILYNPETKAVPGKKLDDNTKKEILKHIREQNGL